MISIITPVYNAEKFISSMIDSVLVQTYQDWELILVDDGSKDASAEICKEYAAKDTRIRVIHQHNRGPAHLPTAMIGLNQPFLSGSFKR